MKKSMMMATAIALGAAMPSGANGAKGADRDVQAAIEAFVKAGDKQDLAALEPLLHEQFRVVFRVAGSDDLTVLDRATYEKLLEDKKIGGDARKLKVVSLEQHGGLAEARVRLEGMQARFEGHMTLVRTQTGWKLIQDATLFFPKAE